MGKFAQKDPLVVAKSQAVNIIKQIQGNHLRSVGTVRNYEQALARVAKFANQELQCGLRQLTPEQAVFYLEVRSEVVGQKTLDMERQAIQAMMQHVTKILPLTERLVVVKSEHDQILTSRAYTQEQVALVAQAQTELNALATEIAYVAGLRSHELFSLRPASEQPADPRPAEKTKWQGREGVHYTVQGKGGLVREVLLPSPLAQRLEVQRLPTSQRVTDRGIHYTKHYGLNAGQTWSASFSRAATRVLGWSSGSHGVRHSYAQERMRELQHLGLLRDAALKTVSQEMGHFRPEITEIYLR